jgi:hypothetical protein
MGFITFSDADDALRVGSAVVRRGAPADHGSTDVYQR